MKNFGNKLIALRKSHTMSQDDLAAELNVSRQTISSWENDRTLPSMDLLEKMAIYYKIDANYFFDEVSHDKEDKVAKNKNGTLLGLTITISMIHLVMTLLGKVEIFYVMISPLLIAIFYSIMNLSFNSGIKNNDFTMIAGCQQKNSLQAIKNKLRSMDFLCGIFAIICELLFFIAYFDQRKMLISMTIFIVYISFVIIINIFLKFKYKV